MARQVKDERRRYPRSKRSVPIVHEDTEGGVMNHVDNISANGVLCHTVEPIPLMTKMSIALDLPHLDKGRVECEGIVVRCEPDEQDNNNFRVAILYTEISEQDRAKIEEFVEGDLAEDDESE